MNARPITDGAGNLFGWLYQLAWYYPENPALPNTSGLRCTCVVVAANGAETGEAADASAAIYTAIGKLFPVNASWSLLVW